MRRKLFNTSQWRRAAAVGALLLAGRAAQAQEATQAKMWAAAASYVYHDDPNIKPIVAKLDAALGQPTTLGEFEQKLLAANGEVARISKTPNVHVLQRQFGNMRTMNALQLYKNLPDSLGKMPARTSGERKQKLAALGTTLMALAQTPQTVAPSTAAAPDETAAAAGPVVATPPAAPATSPLVWAALVMSGLSLLGVIRLLSRSSGSASSSGSGQRSPRQELSSGQYEQVKNMIESALAGQSRQPAPAAKPATARPTPPASPPQSTKQKLANAAKTTMPPTEAPPLPPLASLAADAPAAPPALPEGALVSEVFTVPVKPAAETIPAVVAPGTSVELDPAPAPAPAQRLQFVNEAPFNNTFAARTLSDSPATYSIYEIVSTEQTPDLGQFRVVGNLVSHISNHRNILEPVCEYVAYPQGGETRIVTEQAGEVRRRGADWEIVRPARIRFE